MTEPVDIEALKNEIIEEENIDTGDNTLENLQTKIEKSAKVFYTRKKCKDLKFLIV